MTIFGISLTYIRHQDMAITIHGCTHAYLRVYIPSMTTVGHGCRAKKKNKKQTEREKKRRGERTSAKDGGATCLARSFRSCQLVPPGSLVTLTLKPGPRGPLPPPSPGPRRVPPPRAISTCTHIEDTAHTHGISTTTNKIFCEYGTSRKEGPHSPFADTRRHESVLHDMATY